MYQTRYHNPYFPSPNVLFQRLSLASTTSNRQLPQSTSPLSVSELRPLPKILPITHRPSPSSDPSCQSIKSDTETLTTTEEWPGDEYCKDDRGENGLWDGRMAVIGEGHRTPYVNSNFSISFFLHLLTSTTPVVHDHREPVAFPGGVPGGGRGFTYTLFSGSK